MAKRLTKKEKGFVKDYIATGNGVQSALKNYNTDDYATAGVIAVENLEKPKIQKAIADALPDHLLNERHLELLNKREVFVTHKANGQKEYEIIDQPDTQAVSKALDMAYKIKGRYPKEGGTNIDKTLIINITGETAERYGLIPTQQPEDNS